MLSYRILPEPLFMCVSVFYFNYPAYRGMRCDVTCIYSRISDVEIRHYAVCAGTVCAAQSARKIPFLIFEPDSGQDFHISKDFILFLKQILQCFVSNYLNGY